MVRSKCGVALDGVDPGAGVARSGTWGSFGGRLKIASAVNTLVWGAGRGQMVGKGGAEGGRKWGRQGGALKQPCWYQGRGAIGGLQGKGRI